MHVYLDNTKHPRIGICQQWNLLTVHNHDSVSKFQRFWKMRGSRKITSQPFSRRKKKQSWMMWTMYLKIQKLVIFI